MKIGFGKAADVVVAFERGPGIEGGHDLEHGLKPGSCASHLAKAGGISAESAVALYGEAGELGLGALGECGVVELDQGAFYEAVWAGGEDLVELRHACWL